MGSWSGTLGSSISKGNSSSFSELQYTLENEFCETWTLLSRQHFIYSSNFFKAIVRTWILYEILQTAATHHQCLPAWPSTQNAEYLNKN